MQNKTAENLHIADLIYSHLLGRLSQEGEEELTRWASASAANRRLLDSLENRDFFLRQWKKFNAFDRETGWKKLQEKWPALRMMAYDGTYYGYSPPPQQRRRRIGGLALGFVLLLIFFMGYQYYWRQKVPDGPLTVHTANGGRCSMSMPDGSMVDLNAASYARFATYYGQPQREVTLCGEGYFEIQPLQSAGHRKIPFVVHVIRPASMRAHNWDSSLLTITATGTVFNIRAYDNDSSIRTTLVSGTLDVQRTGDSAIHLTKGDSYVLNRDGSHRIQTNEVKEAISWKDGEFIFRDRPLDEILQELARTYDVKVDYQDTPPGTFNLRGNRSESLKTILDRLQGANHVHFIIEDSKITVSVSH